MATSTHRALIIAGVALALSEAALAAGPIEGTVLDLNGHVLQQAMVTLTKDAGQPGPAAVTVFADDKGRFHFPEGTARGSVTAKMLGYRVISQDAAKPLRIIMQPDANQAGVAPASA